ncbi:TIR domain-containing protein [Caenorhabditis elegans]|uniref:TIR domain-containing protein n=1 Tax=Caenorhabditis elegans TaxID=6239 RepID=Q95XQ4_CAEEL|nr:TIR domain-containing protein [Caenorhabditis elegans]CCD69903.1 TIR domain-containing protein [Caenorhabditis elegans]|eukprot:NP_490966.2 Uncharacterized protein CELE_Y39G10AR.5 [Caenorhabditis elegans]
MPDLEEANDWSCDFFVLTLIYITSMVFAGVCFSLTNTVKHCVEQHACTNDGKYLVIALVFTVIGLVAFFTVYKLYNWNAKKVYLPLLTFHRNCIVAFSLMLLLYQFIESDVVLCLYSASWGFLIACYIFSTRVQIASFVMTEDEVMCMLFIFFLTLMCSIQGAIYGKIIHEISIRGFNLGWFIVVHALVFFQLNVNALKKNERKEGFLNHCNTAYRLPHKMTSSLANITAAQIARHINDGRYTRTNILEGMDTKFRDTILSKLLLLNPKAYQFIAKTTQVEKSLSIGKRVFELEYYARHKSIITTLTIVLHKKKYWEKIQKLDIRECEAQLTPGWVKQIGIMLSSLTTLEISNKPLSKEDFSELCDSFPNLVQLDISDTGIRKLDGIFKLKHLKVLWMRNLQFECSSDMLDLFKLTGLTALDVSRDVYKTNIKTIMQFVECGIILPNLTFLDASGTDLNENLLNSLASHPKLQQIVAIDTNVQYIKTTGHEILSFGNLQTSLRILKHFVNLKRSVATRKCLLRITTQLKQFHNDTKQYDVVKCLRHAIEAIETFRPNEQLKAEIRWNDNTYITGLNCLIEISRNKSHIFHPLDAKLVLDILLIASERILPLTSSALQHPCQAVWEAIQNLVDQEFDWLDYDQIGTSAMRFALEVYLRPDRFLNQATSVVETCTRLSPSQDFSGYLEKKLTTCVINLIKEEIINGNERQCISFLKIVYSMTLCSKSACEDILKNGKFASLVWCLQNCNSDELHLEVLHVIRNLSIVHKSSIFKKHFTATEFKVFHQLLNDWTSNKAYNVFTIISLRIFSSERDWTTCEFSSDANDLLIDRFRYFQPSEITEKVEIYLGILEDVLKTSRLEGPVLWALLTLQILTEQKKEFVETIEEYSYILKHIENLKVVSEAVRNATESLLHIMYKL